MMELSCAPCTDKAITDGHEPDSEEAARVPDAVTMVPTVQTFNVGGQQIAAPVALPVCYACRQKQLGTVSKRGLVTA
jgi:hypothetical protein